MEFSKRKIFHWNKQAEISLMKEVVAVRPTSPAQWDTVARHVSSALATARSQDISVTGRAVKDHAQVIQRNFKSEDGKALKRSGTEEEYNELCQLCQDVEDFQRDHRDVQEMARQEKANKEADNRMGMEMRDAAMKRLGQKQDKETPKKRARTGSAMEELMTLVKHNQELKAKELELEERRVALRERETEANKTLLTQQMELIKSLLKK